MSATRPIQAILADIRRENKNYEVADTLIIEALEALAEHSHAPVPIADVVREVLKKETTP